jgi:hypothetical protein
VEREQLFFLRRCCATAACPDPAGTVAHYRRAAATRRCCRSSCRVLADRPGSVAGRIARCWRCCFAGDDADTRG